MKLFFKRAGFLMLMLVLGLFSLVAHQAGYPFAWRFRTDQSYWLPLAYGLDVLCVVAVLALLFWGLRSFLFGRGRPWLAWLSIATWVLVWAAYSWHEVGGRPPLWSPGLFVGAQSLNEKVAALQQQPWSADSIKALPEPLREQVCSNAILEEQSRVVASRDGFPIEMGFPADMAEKGLFVGDACPAKLVQQYKTLASLTAQLQSTIERSLPDALNAFTQVKLLGHPDAILGMSELYRKHANDPVTRAIATKEFQLRLHTNGQAKDHEWDELPGHASDTVKAQSLNPRIWRHGNEPGSDTWNFWTRSEHTDGETHLDLRVADCKKGTVELQLYIVRSADGAARLMPAGLSEAVKVKPGTWGAEWLRKVCNGKDKEVRLSAEQAQRKFGG